MDALKLPQAPWDGDGALDAANHELEQMTTGEVMQWALETFAPHITLASSFGAEDMVLLDMWAQSNNTPVDVFCLDTGLLFSQTYALIAQVQTTYHITVQRIRPRISIVQQANEFGPSLWSHNPDQCCQIRKVDPLASHLTRYQAWVTGIRRDQNANRRTAPLLGWDPKHGLLKINPLAKWSYDDVFRYLKTRNVPYNPMHDVGYPSIGCEPCTLPVTGGQDPRAGRWQGKEKTECGLHL